MDDLDRRWDASWPGVPPIGDRLRRSQGSRWVRIHAIPLERDGADGSDHPDALDRDGIAQRHRTVIDELFGSSGRVVVFAEDWPSRDGASGWVSRWLPQARSWRRLPADGDDGAAELSVATVTADQLAGLLVPVRDGRALLVAADAGMERLYAPYDLGADLFFIRDAERVAFRRRHRDWLSPRPDGL